MKLLLHLTNKFYAVRREGGGLRFLNVAFVAEIEIALKLDSNVEQPCLPCSYATSEPALQDAEGLAALKFRFRIDEVRNCFRLREIQFAVQKSAAGEFARLRRPNAAGTRQ